MSRPVASVSLDADNLWSYLKTHGDPAWERRPSYLPALADRLLELWSGHGIQGTVFVVGFDAARDDGAQLVSRLASAGHEIANHSFEHEPWLHLYSRSRLDDELARTEAAITAAGAPRPRGFRGPGYSLSADLLDLLEARDYGYDATVLPTWIGPLARAYYLRSSQIDRNDREQRVALFGSVRDVLRPNKPFRWATRPHDLPELPITVYPGLRVPFHVSYVLYLHAISPRLAATYLDSALATCRALGRGPSILLHPLDLLDASDAPGLEFFPGMSLPASEKHVVVHRMLRRLTEWFDVGPTARHAAQAQASGVRLLDPASVRPSEAAEPSAAPLPS